MDELKFLLMFFRRYLMTTGVSSFGPMYALKISDINPDLIGV